MRREKTVTLKVRNIIAVLAGVSGYVLYLLGSNNLDGASQGVLLGSVLLIWVAGLIYGYGIRRAEERREMEVSDG